MSTTIKRDALRIWQKIRYVMMPRKMMEDRAKELRNWDLWGPLVLCICLAVTLSSTTESDDSSLVFEMVFVIVWVGAGIVAINGQLLGGKM